MSTRTHAQELVDLANQLGRFHLAVVFSLLSCNELFPTNAPLSSFMAVLSSAPVHRRLSFRAEQSFPSAPLFLPFPSLALLCGSRRMALLTARSQQTLFPHSSCPLPDLSSLSSGLGPAFPVNPSKSRKPESGRGDPAIFEHFSSICIAISRTFRQTPQEMDLEPPMRDCPVPRSPIRRRLSSLPTTFFTALEISRKVIRRKESFLAKVFPSCTFRP